MNKERLKAAIFCRESTLYGTFEPEYDHDTIAYQIGACFAYIVDHGIEYCGQYVYDDIMKAIDTIVADHIGGRIDCIIVRDMDVISSSESKWRFFCDTFPVLIMGAEDGMFSKTDYIPPWDEEKYQPTDDHKNKISESATGLVQARMQEGKVVGRPPYGYIVSDGRLVIDTLTASVVREIYTLAMSNHNPTQICEYLNQMMIPTPTQKNHWNVSTIQAILKNDVYCGNEYVPAIIDSTMFNEVQANHEPKKRTKSRDHSRGPFPMIQCDVCGRLLAYADPERVPRLKTASYYCNQHSGKKPDEVVLEKNPRINVDDLCKKVTEICNGYLGASEELLLQEAKLSAIDTDLQKEELAARKIELGKEILQLTEDYADNKLSEDEYKEFVKSLTEDYSGINQQTYLSIFSFIKSVGHFQIRRIAPMLRCCKHMDEYNPIVGTKIIKSIRLKADGSIAVSFIGDELAQS